MRSFFWITLFFLYSACAVRPSPIYKTVEKDGYLQVYFHSSNTPSLIRPGVSRSFMDDQEFDRVSNPYRIACSGRLYLPTKNPEKPLPTLVISHPINGFKDNTRYKDMALRLGMAVFLLDHYGQQPVDAGFPQRHFVPQGSIPKKLYEGPSFDSSVIDLYEAFRVLHFIPNIDPKRIYAMGISRGAIVVDRANRRHYRDKLLDEGNFAGFIMMCPFILDQEIHPKIVSSPMLYLLGGCDYVTPYKVALDYTRKLFELGSAVRTVVYPDGYHVFPHKKPKKIPKQVVDLTQLAHKYTASEFTLLSWEQSQPGRLYSWSSYPFLVGLKYMSLDWVRPELQPFNKYPHEDSQKEVHNFLERAIMGKNEFEIGVYFKGNNKS